MQLFPSLRTFYFLSNGKITNAAKISIIAKELVDDPLTAVIFSSAEMALGAFHRAMLGV
ncbi:hypothetical protein [Thioclava sp. GXIMD2076]|uniref:Uncharacterized protein n=1 Tax=Thioclava kandeliae TaxID=3070818 RepID=A0ABV1SD55_9RHOB